MSLDPYFAIVDSLNKVLFGADVAFRGLDGGVAEQQLHLLQIASCFATELGASAAQIVRREFGMAHGGTTFSHERVHQILTDWLHCGLECSTFAQGPTSPQARRSLALCACMTCATAALLSSGLTIFSDQILQPGDVQCLIHNDALQRRVLFLQLLQGSGFAHVDPPYPIASSVNVAALIHAAAIAQWSWLPLRSVLITR